MATARASDMTCGVCDAQHITNFAEYWCPECEEGLCSNCHKYHSISKASRTHNCIPFNQLDKLPACFSEIEHHCKEHGNKYTNYCRHHDTLCCPDCISSTHGDCKGFLSIQEIIKTAKTSVLLDNMEQSIFEIESNIEKVIRNREHNLSNIKQQRQILQDDLKSLRDQINSKLDTLEQNFETELHDVEKSIETKLGNLITRLYREKTSINTLKVNIITLKEHASDLQTFIGSKKYQAEVEKVEKYMRSLSEDGSLDEINLKCSLGDRLLEILGTLTFGPVSIETGSPSLVLRTERDKQAQIMTVAPQPSQKPIKDIKLSLLHTFNIPKPGFAGYKGCIIHPNGKMMLTDSLKSKLILLDDDGKIDQGMNPCSSYINDVTVMDDQTVAVTTDSGINIITIVSKETEKVIGTRHQCYGVVNHKCSLLWGGVSKGIMKMDLSDGRITTVVKQGHMPHSSYITTYGCNIYQTNRLTKTVVCYTMKGEKLWEYKNEAVLKDPVGITVDSNGNIYVTSENSHSVAVITADGKEGRQLLSQREGLEHPFGIYYERTKNKILIVNGKGPAFLYHVSSK